jgi:large subunit ribosomal protein L4
MNKKETVKDSAKTTIVIQPVVAQDLDFDTSVFKKATPHSFSTSVRVLMRNWAQGTVASQGRADVSRTNRKPWKQKGTGRARAGSARSPLWKGGGVIFGPQARVCTLKMSKKSRQKVMLTLLANYLEGKNVVCADWSLVGDQPKTADAQKLLNDSGLAGRKVVLFVAPYDFQSAVSFANIPNVHPLSFDQANVYDLANSDCWLFLKKDFDHFKGMVAQWL